MKAQQLKNKGIVALYNFWIFQSLFVVTILLSVPFAFCEDPPSLSDLKGAFILNFIKFARFSDKGSNLTVCVYKNPQVVEFLTKNTPPSIQERPVIIKDLTSPADSNACNVAYVPSGKQAVTRGLLLITDEGGEGVIELLLRDEKLVFGISSEKASLAAISFPSQVMSLAVQLGSISRYNVSDKEFVYNKQSNARNAYYGPRLDTPRNGDVYSLPRLG